MGVRTTVGFVAMAMAVGACQNIPSSTSVAEYCADPGNADTNVCKLNVEIEGQRTALSETNLNLAEARAIADEAMASSESASSKADRALSRADDAFSRADAAFSRPLTCETRVLNQTNIGTCEPGYKLVSCVQTRYTHRAGGLSFLREINDEQCRFNSQVLEMQVRCCTGGVTAQDADDLSGS